MNVICVAESPRICQYSRHSHPYAELVFVSNGRMTILINNCGYEVSEGDVLIIPPHTPHEGVEGEDFVNIYVHVKNLDFSDVLCVRDYDGSARTLVTMLLRVMSEQEIGYSEISDKLFDALRAYVKKYSKRSFKYDFVSRIKNLIYENLENPTFRISDEVRHIGFNPDYFRRCFVEEMGQTPVAYMTGLRIERAKNLLVQVPPISVEKVAEQCGFSDSFYFSKIFKKHTGSSPLGYRKQIQG